MKAKPARVVALGLGWAIVTLACLVAGPVVLGLWLGVNAAVAAAEVARNKVYAAVAAGVLVVGAGFGILGAGVGAVAAVAVLSRSDRRWVAAVLAVAAAAPVVLRATHGLVPPLVLLVYAAAYDAADYVVGSDARWRWEGPLAGIACIGTVTVAAAAIFPQFKGATPWELGLLAAVLAPLGPVLSQRLVGRTDRVPAVRRLDSLVLLAPVWALAAATLVG